MSFIKASSIKVANGFLYGVGFMLALVAIGSGSFFYMEKHFEEEAKARDAVWEAERKTRFREFDETALLELSVSRERINSQEFTLLGTIENKGDASWSAVGIKAELFNEAGEFIEECSEYVTKLLRSGETINFKMSCGHPLTLQLNDYKYYKISVVDAHYHRQ